MIDEQGTSTAGGDSPDALVVRCQEGDAAAFVALFVTYRETVYSLALHYTGEAELAEDVMQDVFVKLLTRIRQYRRDAEFTSWLYRMVVNTCGHYRRKLQRYVALDEGSAGTKLIGEARQEANAARRQAVAELKAGILALRPELRLPLLLHCDGGLSYAEISRLLLIPCGTVASRIGRARRALDKRLAAHGPLWRTG
jgi:RNA polymerase sigma-70 factor (ECF subfamily)